MAMKTSFETLVACAALVLVPAVSWSQTDPGAPAAELSQPVPPPEPQVPQAQLEPDAQALPAGQWVYTQQYGWTWMASGVTPPEPQAPQAQPRPDAQALPAGQWVYTQQYGWIWMVYGEAYTHVPAEGYGEPFMYVYYPVVGWTWLVAPWVWGWGPWPYFGINGPWRFAWYGHGWWRYPQRWHLTGPWRGGYGARSSYGFRGQGYAPRGVAPGASSALRGGVGGVRGGGAPARGFTGHFGWRR
jgi:hypothetical protein